MYDVGTVCVSHFAFIRANKTGEHLQCLTLIALQAYR